MHKSAAQGKVNSVKIQPCFLVYTLSSQTITIWPWGSARVNYVLQSKRLTSVWRTAQFPARSVTLFIDIKSARVNIYVLKQRTA